MTVFHIKRCADAEMFPSVRDGDLVISYRLDKDYMKNDVVVYKAGKKSRIGRVVAMAGDKVDITEEGLFVNGYLQNEPMIYEETDAYEEGIRFPITVKKNEVFVLGDERKAASDSRIFGTIKLKNTYGEIIMILRKRGF